MEIFCTHCGMRVIGTKRPERISSRAKYNSKMALTRVVQKVIMPRSETIMVRMRNAPQMAMKKTSACMAVKSIVALKTHARKAASGSQSKMTTTFQPEK